MERPNGRTAERFSRKCPHEEMSPLTSPSAPGTVPPVGKIWQRLPGAAVVHRAPGPPCPPGFSPAQRPFSTSNAIPMRLCKEIPVAKALEWGLVNRVVRHSQLDAAVDAMREKLANKLLACIRSSKQKPNFWRAFSWHPTVGHARDSLALNNLTFETAEGIAAFNEKRAVDKSRVRERLA